MHTFLSSFFIAFLLTTGYLKPVHGKNNEAQSRQAVQDDINNFWNWFTANQNDLRKPSNRQEKKLAEGLSMLNKMARGVSMEFGVSDNGIIPLIITAKNNRQVFPQVQSIIDRAPVIEGWRFVAFCQRLPIEQVKNMVLRSENHELDPNKMKFYPIVNEDSLAIIVYVNGVTEKNYEEIATGSLLLIDNILGEYDAVKKVHSYDFRQFPKGNNEQIQLVPLLGLANFIDNFHFLGRDSTEKH